MGRIPDLTFNQFAIFLLYPHCDTSDVAEFLRIPVETVKSYAFKQGLKKDNSRWAQEEETYILKNYNSETQSIQDIANHLGRTRWSVINKYRLLLGLRSGLAYKDRNNEIQIPTHNPSVSQAQPVEKVKQTDPGVRKLLDDIYAAHKELGSRSMAPLKALLIEQGVISDASLSQILCGQFVSKGNILLAKELLKRIKTLTAEKANAFKRILSTPADQLPKVEEKKRGKPAKSKTEKPKVKSANAVKAK